MNDAMHSLHDQANNALVRNLFQRVRDLRSGAGQVSQAPEALAEKPSVPANTQGQADAGSDIGGCEGVKA